MIPIKDAMILWNPAGERPEVKPKCKIVEYPLRYGSYYDRRYICSHGACYGNWQFEMNTEQRKLILMIEAWHMVLRDGVPPEDVHNAMMVIPEYRDMLSYDFSVNKVWLDEDGKN